MYNNNNNNNNNNTIKLHLIGIGKDYYMMLSATC